MLNQVAKDSQLLDTAQDFLHFVTKFFEPISVSATHIYHSALELCPTSSIVRKLYYDRYHGITRFPRVVIGIPDSWDPTLYVSSKDHYKGCRWSPCGRFIAARTEAIVEIRNQLTFQLLAVLQSPEKPSTLTGPLGYSPDGRSLACGLSNGIVIWDIQTGGVVRSIDFQGEMLRLVWSLDGKTIGTAHPYMNNSSSVKTYDVASGAQLFAENFEREWIFDLWACETSFRFISIPRFPGSDYKPSVFEIGPTCIKVEQLPTALPPAAISFSPSTYRISSARADTLRILDTRNSQSLLQESHTRSFFCFSSDASLFASAHNNGFRVWKYTSGSYLLLGEYPLPHFPSFSPRELHFQFSPTLTSILFWYENVLQVWRLHGSPTTPKTCCQYATISRSGRYVATVYGSQSTVAITNFHSQAPPQLIDTGREIEGLAITGDVLLVAFSETVVGWLLTEEGRVDGVVDNRTANQSDSIWIIASPPQRPKSLCFRVSGQVGAIGAEDILPFTYHVGTGGIPDSSRRLQQFDLPWVTFYKQSDYQEYHFLRRLDTRQSDTSPKDSWFVPHTTTGKAGWVVDPEGRHRFWVPVEWRTPWDPKNCHNDISMLFARVGDQPVMIKF